jgi:hypothetical protein
LRRWILIVNANVPLKATPTVRLGVEESPCLGTGPSARAAMYKESGLAIGIAAFLPIDLMSEGNTEKS